MKILINDSSGIEARQSDESLERLLRIALTRYASFIYKVTMVLDADRRPHTSSGYRVRLIVEVDQRPDVEIEESQPRLEWAVGRAIHRADGILRQYARREAKRA